MMLDRRAFLGTLAFLAAPRSSEGQQAAAVTRIGLPVDQPGRFPLPAGGLPSRLRDLGHVAGRNLVIEYRYVAAEPLNENMRQALRDVGYVERRIWTT